MGKSSRTEVFVVENAILSYPHLFKPQVAVGATEPKYSCALLVDEATAQLVYEKAQQIAGEAFNNGEQNLQKFRWPVQKAADKQSTNGSFPYRDNPRTADRYLINANASQDYPPQVVGQDRQPVVDRGQIYAGCIVAAGIQLFTYNTAGNIGVGVGLSAIMKQADGEQLGGSSVDAKSLFNGVQAQAPQGGSMPGGAPMPAGPFAGGQPAQDPNKPPFLS
jgi:hypothetical protein